MNHRSQHVLVLEKITLRYLIFKVKKGKNQQNNAYMLYLKFSFKTHNIREILVYYGS